jgi:hypothetical protein
LALPCDPNTDPNCGGGAPPCEPVPPSFVGCYPDQPPPPPGCTSDTDCPNGYCELYWSDPPVCDGEDCGRPAPPPYGQCVYPSCDDGTTPVCLIAPPQCLPGQTFAIRNGCFECVDARSCSPGNGQCSSDLDCPNGYCEQYATCTAIGCPRPPPSQCVYPSCDDGQPVLCDALPPSCGPGEVAAARNGCWACVDARTCGSTPPQWCWSDADCHNGYCDQGGATDPGGSGDRALPAPPPGQCVFPGCGDGTELMCRMVEPDCGDGNVAAIRNGCYQCVDARTCQ